MIPELTRKTLEAYRDRHQPPGDFLRCVLSNDLRGALLRADPSNRKALLEICLWIDEHLPSYIYGSKTQYNLWVRKPQNPERDNTPIDLPQVLITRPTGKQPSLGDAPSQPNV